MGTFHDRDWYDEEWLKTADFQTLEAELMNAVYNSCHLFERLEGVRRIFRNGHHMQQELCRKASDMLRSALRKVPSEPGVE